ncbi:zinc finger-like domain-containing protein [Cardiobacteriaceae bacterium TAE3-ERU3]|nr:zinc finger-like domain-containing protein [Cardiobacteriaceae bacterium TAE3-ERU3]
MSNNDLIEILLSTIKSNNILIDNLSAAKENLLIDFDDYEEKGKNMELFQINFNPNKYAIKREDFNNLYTQYLKKSGIYDEIKSNAESCLYCLISSIDSLDHYLPKSIFPQFSILPINLVPSCTECNSKLKRDNFFNIKEDQLIHPYLDKSYYFEEKWIYCSFNLTDDYPIFNFYVNCPDDWDQADKKRVVKHFNFFNLSKRYSVNAVKEYVNILSVQSKSTPDLNVLCNYILKPIADNELISINSWRRSMYQAIYNHFNKIRLNEIDSTCSNCKGNGSFGDERCDKCDGVGSNWIK